MKLRKLEKKDIPFMLEWMKDFELNCFFRFNPEEITFNYVNEFVEKSRESEFDRHFAIVDDDDIYMGTISLKNIDLVNKNAEYAISLRKHVIGTGIAGLATKELINYAFYQLNLHKIYLNVLEDNIRAIKFYEKMGFQFEGEFKEHIFIKNEYKSLKLYAIVR